MGHHRLLDLQVGVGKPTASCRNQGYVQKVEAEALLSVAPSLGLHVRDALKLAGA